MSQNLTSLVTVNFSGLMVLYQDKSDNHFEAGVLRPEIAHHHRFGVTIEPDDEKDVELFLSMGDRWTLDVVSGLGQQVTKDVIRFERGHRTSEDNNAGQFDFSWIIDFEGGEFHRRELDLIPGSLRPIIHFGSGKFYTKYKSFKLDRKQGGGDFSAFGFIAETSSIDIQLQQGEELVLRVANTGPEGEIFRLPFVHGINSEVSIENIPISDADPHDDHSSHFRFYYDAFRNIPAAEQFDFRPKEPQERAINQFPTIRPEHTLNQPPKVRRIDTVGGAACGKVLLSRRNKSLE